MEPTPTLMDDEAKQYVHDFQFLAGRVVELAVALESVLAAARLVRFEMLSLAKYERKNGLQKVAGNLYVPEFHRVSQRLRRAAKSAQVISTAAYNAKSDIPKVAIPLPRRPEDDLEDSTPAGARVLNNSTGGTPELATAAGGHT